MLTRFPKSVIVGYDQRYHDRGWLPDGTEGHWVTGLPYVSAAPYMHPDGHEKLRRVDVATA